VSDVPNAEYVRALSDLAAADPLFRLQLECLLTSLADVVRAFDALPDAVKRAAQIDGSAS